MGSTSIPTKTFHRKYFPYCLPGVIQVQVPHCFFWPVGWGWHRKEPSNLQRKTLHSPRLSFMHFCHPCPSCISAIIALHALLPFVLFCPSCISALHALLPFVHFCPSCISALHAFLLSMHFCPSCISAEHALLVALQICASYCATIPGVTFAGVQSGTEVRCMLIYTWCIEQRSMRSAPISVTVNHFKPREYRDISGKI